MNENSDEQDEFTSCRLSKSTRDLIMRSKNGNESASDFLHRKLQEEADAFAAEDGKRRLLAALDELKRRVARG